MSISTEEYQSWHLLAKGLPNLESVKYVNPNPNPTQNYKSGRQRHSGEERSIGETKYIIGDFYTIGIIWANTFKINWRKNWPLGAFWEIAKIALFAPKNDFWGKNRAISWLNLLSWFDLIWFDHHLRHQILMIFLFFGSSIAHQEPELQRFEDQSIFVGISATRAPVAKHSPWPCGWNSIKY